MSEVFPATGPRPLSPDDPSAATVEEARRGWALELAVQLHCARAHLRPSPLSSALDPDGDVTKTADRFAAYLRGGAE